MKLIAYISIWIALALAFSLAAQAQEDLYTVTPYVENQVLFNRLEQRMSGRFEIAESIPVRIIDGPWNPDGAHVKVDANSLLAEQLARMNHPKKSSMSFPVKEGQFEKIMDIYNLDVKRENPCALTMDRKDCILTEPIYSFSAKVQYDY